jgi:amidophosphoribosyltransferase
MEKQHNRGQDGAGIASIKFDLDPGEKYMNRLRSGAESPVNDIFLQIFEAINLIKEKSPDRLRDINWLKSNIDFTGELFLGHLRYGTYGKNDFRNIHPVIRENNWKTKNLILAGNFNLTNVDELFNKLVDLGQYPVETSDTVTMLKKSAISLMKRTKNCIRRFKQEGFVKKEISTHC